MNWSPSKYPLIINPYDSFMKKHLQHYGYFTGRNVAIARFGFEPKRGIKNDDSDESDTESDNDSENSTNRLKDKFDWKSKTKCHELKIDNYKWWLKDNALFNMGLKDGEYQREPRWPIEMQVLPDKIRHIDTAFPNPEPFYVKTGSEETPMCSGSDSKSKTVFYYNPINCGYFIRSRVGGNREGCQKICADIPEIEMESTLLFESRFESGNLMKAIKINDREYELYMRYDLYTSRHTQWFYFQIKNAKPDVEYRFTICNFLKNDSLYNSGMKPVMYSELDAKNKGIGWRRWGKDIKYYRNNIRSDDDNGISRSLYSLTWTCRFPNANDTYYFAHCYPYTYSDLQDYVRDIQEDPVKSKYCKVKVLCRTLAENLVYMLSITNPASTEQENAAKKGVVISARVHPGETNSSWMMKGFLDFLLGSSADAKLLRDNFIFKMIPMLNPDGVIIGNYRCSLTGRDLNRNYRTVLKEAFPSIWHTREMIKKFMEEREVILYCDLHGHSRKNNVFIYGCHNNSNPKKRFQEHIFPIIMSKNAKDQFSYKSCKFKIQKSKQGTGRVVMWNMGIMNSFTMEATFNGSTLNQKAGYQFSQRDLEQLGYYFLDSLLDYCDPDQSKCKNILNEVESNMKEQIRSKLESQGINCDQLNLLDDFDSFNFNFDDNEDESSAASDSSGDDGLPLHLERFAKLRQRKKRKVKTRKTALIQPSDKPCKNPKDQTSTTPKLTNNQPSINIVVSNNNSNKENNNNNNITNNTDSITPINTTSYIPIKNIGSNNLGNNLNVLLDFKKKDDVPAKKEKKLTGLTAPTVVSASKEKETLLKEQEKKLLRPLMSSNQSIQIQHLPQHPKSAKALNNGIPVFTSERAEERANTNSTTVKRSIQNQTLQLDTESAQAHADAHLLAFRYTLPNEIQFPGNFNPHNHLCEHHRKKLSDMFLIRHLSNEENKLESDGDASDDEAEEDVNDDAIGMSGGGTSAAGTTLTNGTKRRPTLEEYVKKHVFTNRSESTNLARHRHRRTKTSQPNLFSTQNRLKQALDQASQPPAPQLEIRNFQKDDSNRDLESVEINKQETVASLYKASYDLMPKYVIKQLADKRINNNSGASLVTPYNGNGMFSAKAILDSNDAVSLSNSTRRAASRSNNKIQSAIQKQPQASLTLSVQSTPLIGQLQPSQAAQLQRTQANSSKLNTNDSTNTASTAYAKMNEEFLNSIGMASANANVSASSISSQQQQQQQQQNGSATLFSSTFVSMNSNGQLKSQYEKITRANSGMLLNSTRSTSTSVARK